MDLINQNVVAVVGEYTDKDGKQKLKYRTVGRIVKINDKPYVSLDKTFNPAGLAKAEYDSVLLGIYPQREKEEDAPF